MCKDEVILTDNAISSFSNTIEFFKFSNKSAFSKLKDKTDYIISAFTLQHTTQGGLCSIESLGLEHSEG